MGVPTTGVTSTRPVAASQATRPLPQVLADRLGRYRRLLLRRASAQAREGLPSTADVAAGGTGPSRLEGTAGLRNHPGPERPRSCPRPAGQNSAGWSAGGLTDSARASNS